MSFGDAFRDRTGPWGKPARTLPPFRMARSLFGLVSSMRSAHQFPRAVSTLRWWAKGRMTSIPSNRWRARQDSAIPRTHVPDSPPVSYRLGHSFSYFVTMTWSNDAFA
jgi:hypothetical protein